MMHTEETELRAPTPVRPAWRISIARVATLLLAVASLAVGAFFARDAFLPVPPWRVRVPAGPTSLSTVLQDASFEIELSLRDSTLALSSCTREDILGDEPELVPEVASYQALVSRQRHRYCIIVRSQGQEILRIFPHGWILLRRSDGVYESYQGESRRRERLRSLLPHPR